MTEDNMNRRKPQQDWIIRLDDHIVAVNKSAGMPVVSPRSAKGTSLRAIVAAHLGGKTPYVVHRIDRDTSGVVVFARDAETHRALSLLFEHREVEKTYLGIVRGRPAPAEGVVKLPLQRDRHNPTRMVVAKRGGKASRTDYRTLEVFRGFSLVELKPRTGRMHQVRVHLAALGYPLAVDPIYGGAEAVCLSEFKRDYRPKKGREEHPLISRLTLHAYRIAFTLTGVGQVRLEASLSRDFEIFLKQLSKHASLPSER